MKKFPIDKKFSYDNHVNNLLRENSNPSKSKFIYLQVLLQN